MFGELSVSRKPRQERRRGDGGWSYLNFVPGLIVGFLLGLLVEVPKGRLLPHPPPKPVLGNRNGRKRNSQVPTNATNEGEELKMVLVVRQDLKMGGGKIASQCAHAAVGTYTQLLSSQRSLLNRWEQCGQPKIVVTCKNQQEMNDLRGRAERIGLPTFVVSDAGRTQIAAGSKTVLAIGPGDKNIVDSVTRHLRLL